MVNQSKKCGQEGGKFHINKTKLHHAEKMIRGAYIELFKGLGYLQTYRCAWFINYRLEGKENDINLVIAILYFTILFQEFEYVGLRKDLEEIGQGIFIIQNFLIN